MIVVFIIGGQIAQSARDFDMRISERLLVGGQNIVVDVPCLFVLSLSIVKLGQIVLDGNESKCVAIWDLLINVDGLLIELLCLIVLDAVLASALAGTVGLLILVLLVPGLYLNRQKWLYAT